MTDAEEKEAPTLVSGSDLRSADGQMSMQMAQSIKASTDRWNQMMKDHRFLTKPELDDMPAGQTEGNFLKVGDGSTALYPEFQFDKAGQVHPVIPQLISLAKNNDWSERSLILWLVTPTGYFDDESPANHLNEPERILAGAHSRFEQSW